MLQEKFCGPWLIKGRQEWKFYLTFYWVCNCSHNLLAPILCLPVYRTLTMRNMSIITQILLYSSALKNLIYFLPFPSHFVYLLQNIKRFKESNNLFLFQASKASYCGAKYNFFRSYECGYKIFSMYGTVNFDRNNCSCSWNYNRKTLFQNCK